VVGINRGLAVGVVFLILAGRAVVEKLFRIAGRIADGQLGGVLGRGGRALGKVEHRHVLARCIQPVTVKARADQFAGCVPAVFLPVAAGLAVGIKRESRGADVVAIDILVGQRIEEVGRIGLF